MKWIDIPHIIQMQRRLSMAVIEITVLLRAMFIINQDKNHLWSSLGVIDGDFATYQQLNCKR